jgi:hypothetical protein
MNGTTGRPKRGDRFISRHMLAEGARPPYGPESYATRVVTAVRACGASYVVYHTSQAAWEAGDRAGRWKFDAGRVGSNVRTWIEHVDNVPGMP